MSSKRILSSFIVLLFLFVGCSRDDTIIIVRKWKKINYSSSDLADSCVFDTIVVKNGVPKIGGATSREFEQMFIEDSIIYSYVYNDYKYGIQNNVFADSIRMSRYSVEFSDSSCLVSNEYSRSLFVRWTLRLSGQEKEYYVEVAEPYGIVCRVLSYHEVYVLQEKSVIVRNGRSTFLLPLKDNYKQ